VDWPTWGRTDDAIGRCRVKPRHRGTSDRRSGRPTASRRSHFPGRGWTNRMGVPSPVGRRPTPRSRDGRRRPCGDEEQLDCGPAQDLRRLRSPRWMPTLTSTTREDHVGVATRALGLEVTWRRERGGAPHTSRAGTRRVSTRFEGAGRSSRPRALAISRLTTRLSSTIASRGRTNGSPGRT